MEGHSDHGADLAQVHIHHSVIVSHRAGIQFFVVLCSAVDLIELFNFVIGLPDRGKAGSLGGHDIHADKEIRAQVLHARSNKFHDFVVYISVTEHSADDGQRHILGTYALDGSAGQIDGDNPRHIDIIRLGQQLFYQLRSAFSHCHGTQSTVSGVGIRTQDHLSAARQHFSGILVDHRLMRGYIDAAVFLGAAKTKHVVILIDRAAHGAKRIVAVGQHIGNGEFFQP